MTDTSVSAPGAPYRGEYYIAHLQALARSLQTVVLAGVRDSDAATLARIVGERGGDTI